MRRRLRLDRPGLLALPFFVGLVILIGVPALLTVWLSLTTSDLIRPSEFVGLVNFRELASDTAFLAALRNSLVFVAAAVPLRLAGALGLALLLHRRMRGGNAVRTAAYTPSVIPDLAYALVWLWLINPLYGPINAALGALALPQPIWLTSAGWAMTAIVLMSAFVMGEGFLVALAARREIPAELEALAAIEGAGVWTTFRAVTLPLLAPTLLVLLVRDIAFSLQATFVPALVVTGGGPPPHATTFLPLFAYREGFEYLRFGYAAAASLAMFVVTLALTLVLWRMGRRWRHSFLV